MNMDVDLNECQVNETANCEEKMTKYNNFFLKTGRE